MFRHKPNTFPSSWSSFIMSVSASCDKDRRQSKPGRSILRGAFSNVLLVYEESEALCFLQTCLPLLLHCSCCEPTHWGRQRLCACWSLLFIYRPLLLLCNAACAALRQHSLLWIIADSVPFLLSTDLHKAELFQFDYHEEQQHQCMTGKLRVPLRWLCFTKTTTRQSASLGWKRKHKSSRARDAEL